MDMKTFLKNAQPEERGRLAELAGTTVGYLYLIGGGHRRPSSKLCKALTAAEPKLTLGELRPDIWGDPEIAKRPARRSSDH